MKKTYSLLLLLGFGISTQAQHTINACGTDEVFWKAEAEDPNCLKVRAEQESFIENFKAEDAVRSTPKYIIPIVFHIVHAGGSENIDDSQIMDEMSILNSNFQKTNTTALNSVVSSFQSIIGDMEMEFRLAQKDENGNPTTGINRYLNSTASNSNTLDAHKINQWDPAMYLNVWVVKNAAGNAGYTYYPDLAETKPQYDGVVIIHNAVGTIGTADGSGVYGGMFAGWSLTHEIGHWLHLYHLWGKSNSIGSSSNCNDDDNVSDTPNEKGANFSCNTSGSSCSSLDNAQNFMVYTLCSKMFTAGQATRAQAVLNSSLADRDKIWQNDNLIATGVLGAAEIEEVNAGIQNISLFPNPMQEQSNLQFTLKERSNVAIDLYNLIGEKVKSISKSDLSLGPHRINIANREDLEAGIYLVRITTEKGIISRKLMIQ